VFALSAGTQPQGREEKSLSPQLPQSWLTCSSPGLKRTAESSSGHGRDYLVMVWRAVLGQDFVSFDRSQKPNLNPGFLKKGIYYSWT